MAAARLVLCVVPVILAACVPDTAGPPVASKPASDASAARIVAKSDRLRPEIVCGAPTPTRPLAIDLKTGSATPP